jgi:dihydrodipicolinate synthase/N-acetylneuraminate lyase
LEYRGSSNSDVHMCRHQSEETSMVSANPTLRQPSAFLPVAMSLGALAVVIAQIVFVGVARQPDEGTAAHLWQILMAVQLPIIVYFAIRYLPRNPRSAALILALQVLAIIAACAPVYLLHW